MDKSELTRLKELAEATLDAQGDCIWGDSLPAGISACDRYFITAVPPYVVLDLIAEIERLEEDLDIRFQDNRVLKDQNQRVARTNMELRERNQRLEKQVNWLAMRCQSIRKFPTMMGGMPEDDWTAYKWREAARKAVEEGNG